jgi:predicted nucleic acid-binding protein
VELADTSAWSNRHKSTPVRADFDSRVAEGEIATCPMVMLELLWTTRDAADFAAARAELEALPHVPIEQRAWQRAMDVFEALAAGGPLHHRRVALPDLLVAAAAELAGIPICHYDADFDVIAELTDQPVRAIAQLGSL